MKKIFAAFLLIGALVTASAAGDTWMTDFDAAKEKAKKENKAILMDFTGSDWCGYCIKLKKSVFSTPEFQKWAEKNVVLMEVDFPMKKKQPAALKKANEQLEQRYEIEGYPTIVFADSSGKKIGQLVGYEGEKPGAWIKKADAIIGKAGKTK